MKQLLKKVASRLPHKAQQELKRRYFARQIKYGNFRTAEPEYDMLSSLVGKGDWVIDIGANIGHYALRLSELVATDGRVIAFEPVPETFELLAANASLSMFSNLTLINAAVSNAVRMSGMTIPKFRDTGLGDCYEAELTSADSALQVFCLTLDLLNLPHQIRLVKIDVEGHELSALQGMVELLRRDHPLLIVEDNDPRVSAFLMDFGYRHEKVAGSSNLVFR
jgi:FkbM family methyltransferase